MKIFKYGFIVGASFLLLESCKTVVPKTNETQQEVAQAKVFQSRLIEAPNREQVKFATPTQRQLDWQEMEYYAFIHFSMNTFTDVEWGYGDEKPESFNPTELDTDQWARVCKEAGMKGIILTAKHHDGFCLWPSKYTEHSVKNSPWKNGKGDIVKELSESCKKYGLKFGIYLSPWDRNHPEYARDEYVKYFHNQLEELITQYGPLFEIWFDGANGGDGYYGGAKEARKIEARTYYQWEKAKEMIRKHQPNAVIFGGIGRDIRWVGNERGYAGTTNWSTLGSRTGESAGRVDGAYLGDENGKNWVPAEVDVSIRPGWYYHKKEDHKVHSLPKLVDIYYESVGRNATLLLNLPPDKRGLIHENDVEQLMKLKEVIQRDFANDLAPKAKVTASNTKGNNKEFDASNTVNNDVNSYWTTDDNITTGTLTYTFNKPITFNRFLVQEYIPYGQRVAKFKLQAKVNGQWKDIANETTIGYKRILRFEPVTTDAVRFEIESAFMPPMISKVGFYNAPNLLVAPEVTRSKDGKITLSAPEATTEIYYTIDGSDPDNTSMKFTEAFEIQSPVTLKAITYDPRSKTYGEINTSHQDIAKKDWKIVSVSSGDKGKANAIIDENPNSYWNSAKTGDEQEVVVDLGENYTLKGFTYFPRQDRWTTGTVKEYQFEVSTDGKNWKKVAEGEFGNIQNNPIEQIVDFNPESGRFIKFKSLKVIDDSKGISLGELGVITE
ncbi:alpha-L-fucosidase [Weeksellaceae bacterium TAE3-ERU29]|nr:alpha-L-fucosidase [Weeksellaceae bacterium TAE3-ERU29]